MKIELKKTKEKEKTVLESGLTSQNNSNHEDAFELWDQSHMLRGSHNDGLAVNRWGCKPSCIPITVILILIVLVVLLPLLDHSSDRPASSETLTITGINKDTCLNSCPMSLVESIPEGLIYPNGSISLPSTYETWKNLIAIAENTIEIASFYWTIRKSDVFPHPSSKLGDEIFQALLSAGTERGLKVKIAQSAPTKGQPNIDTEFLIKRKAAEVRSVNFPRLLGGGVLHTKLWIIDRKHFYIGSANMDWRSLTQVKEMGAVAYNCSCLTEDMSKIFDVYWMMGIENAQIPPSWPAELSTRFNMSSPMNTSLNNELFNTFISSSPPPMCPEGRTGDIDAILNVISHAEKFIYVAVMDYFPLTIYTPKNKYWPYIDNAFRAAAIEHKIKIKLLISWWNHSQSSADYFLRSLDDLTNSYPGVDIEVKRFVVPTSADQAKIPFSRVNHNKYMVTDNTAYIGTSNWSGDYFIDTAGVGLVMQDAVTGRNESELTVRAQLQSVFERDWNSIYARPLIKR